MRKTIFHKLTVSIHFYQYLPGHVLKDILKIKKISRKYLTKKTVTITIVTIKILVEVIVTYDDDNHR